jgi:hypothetical protein
MATRIHLVLEEEEKARLEGAARREGMTLSAWLREAAREKLADAGPKSLNSLGELNAFFAECDRREKGREPDWEAHRKVIEASKGAGAADP